MKNADQVRAALQASVVADEEQDAGESLITRWVVIAESMQPSGARWLHRLDGDASDSRLTPWDRRGLLAEALDDASWAE